MEIKWNQKLFGVEIKDNENHFVISAQPSMVMDWDDAVRYYKDSKVWQLPTCEQLQLIAKHADKVNALIKANEGYVLRGWHWTAEEYDEFYTWSVNLNDGYSLSDSKHCGNYVRAISNLLGF